MDLTDPALAFYAAMTQTRGSTFNSESTPFEYAASLMPHWRWVELACLIVYDLMELHPDYVASGVVTYEMLVELTHHANFKGALYTYGTTRQEDLLYHPAESFNTTLLMNTMDTLVINDLEEELLDVLAANGQHTDQQEFGLYSSIAEPLDGYSTCDETIWRYLFTIVDHLVKAMVGIGREYALVGFALADYHSFVSVAPIHGGQSEYLYAVTVKKKER